MKSVKDPIVKSAASIFLIFSISCTESMLPEVQIKPLSQYPLSQRKNGIALAIDPFFEEERVKNFFDFNLLKDGILPIYVIVENQSDNLVLIHPDDLISAFAGLESSAAVGDVAKTDSSINQGENKQSEIMRSAFLAGLFFGLVIPILTSIIVGEKNYTLIRYNIRRKMFLDSTLSKNEVASGFVFLRVEDKSALSKIKYLLARVKNLNSGEIETFLYPVKARSGR